LDREKAIDLLISNDIESLGSMLEQYDHHWITHILREGFKGYGNFTDEELMSELVERGIRDFSLKRAA